MSGLISWITGANSAQNNAGNLYQNAEDKIISSTGTGSPAAATFANEEMAADRPAFAQEDANAAAGAAASGLTGSGESALNYSNLIGKQDATVAGQIAPLYSQALGQYGQIVGQQPGAQLNAYTNANDQFYNVLGSAAGAVGDAFGVPGVGGAVDPNAGYAPGAGVVADPNTGFSPFSDVNSGGYDNVPAPVESGSYTP